MASQTAQPEIILYWLEKSRAQRVLWLLEELSLPYELKTYKRRGGLAPPELKEIHPLGKSPVLSIKAPGASSPLILAETGVIVEYLSKHYGPQLIPREYEAGQTGPGKETEAWHRYRFYMHYAEGSMMIIMVMALVFGKINDGAPWFLRPITMAITGGVEKVYLKPNFETHFKFLEDQLETAPDGGPYFCGKELSGADIMMSFPVAASRGRTGLSKESHPKLYAYADLLAEREAYKRSVKKIEDTFGEYVLSD